MRHASGQQAAAWGEFTTWSPSGYGRAPAALAVREADDHVVTREQLLAWGEGADHLLGQHFFPGAHFYWDEQIPAVAAQMAEEVDTAAPGLAGW
ncbi:hypothetical protein [Streptomyces sp. R35]|uniref:Thioesterase n=1 Tax=Streptomyces sp. R35 TaxID=3238630 RepID=A0AB39S0P7_9ACTN